MGIHMNSIQKEYPRKYKTCLHDVFAVPFLHTPGCQANFYCPLLFQWRDATIAKALTLLDISLCLIKTCCKNNMLYKGRPPSLRHVIAFTCFQQSAVGAGVSHALWAPALGILRQLQGKIVARRRSKCRGCRCRDDCKQREQCQRLKYQPISAASKCTKSQVSVYLTLAALPHGFFSTKVLQRGSPAPEVNIVSGRARDFVASALILFALVVPTGIMAVVVIDEHFDGISVTFLSFVSQTTMLIN